MNALVCMQAKKRRLHAVPSCGSDRLKLHFREGSVADISQTATSRFIIDNKSYNILETTYILSANIDTGGAGVLWIDWRAAHRVFLLQPPRKLQNALKTL